MRTAWLLPLVFFVSGTAFGLTSSPEALVPAAGFSGNNFAVVGEGLAGIIYGPNYIALTGLAPSVFTSWFALTGQPIPSISAGQTQVVCYPNPFNPGAGQEVTIAYSLAQDQEVRLMIFDLTGQLVGTVIGSSANRGSDGLCRIAWDGKSGFGETVENGIYIVAIAAGGNMITKGKVIVIK